MTFKLTKASDWEFEETVEINTLEDLRSLQDRFRTQYRGWDTGTMIIDFYNDFDDAPTIKIYDFYVE